ncbi:MAG: MopE-related protein [Myxococcota bacterium]
MRAPRPSFPLVVCALAALSLLPLGCGGTPSDTDGGTGGGVGGGTGGGTSGGVGGGVGGGTGGGTGGSTGGGTGGGIGGGVGGGVGGGTGGGVGGGLGGGTGGGTGGGVGGGLGGGTGGGTDGGTGGGTGGGGGRMLCTPNSTQACYSGPPNTQGVGACMPGTQTCNAQGTGYGLCTGEVLPSAENCGTAVDDNCNGQSNEGCVCTPSMTQSCYSGPANTQGVGRCQSGTQTCNAQGTGYDACMGEVLPAASETCGNAMDDNCNGQTDEGCVCMPSMTQSCYSGPAGTAGVGRCQSGTRTCNAQGTGYGPCMGEVLPAASETCGNAIDDNCNGQADEGCTMTTTYAGHAQPIFQAKCGPCHTTFGSGGHNIGTTYSSTQLPSYYCAGLTKGACALVRIQNGTMPAGAGCSGNPAQDSGNPACLNAAQQATLQSWITGGQLP